LDTVISEVFNASSPDLRTDRQLLATTPPPRGLLLRVGRARPGLGGADDPGSQWHLLPDIVVPHPPLRLRPAGKFTLTSVRVTAGITSTTKSAYLKCRPIE
jgi:hypothetical protein